MRENEGRIITGVVFVLAGLFLVMNQFVFKIGFFPWILLIIGIAIFLISLFSGRFFSGLTALLWFGGLCFAFYYNQIIPGLIIIIGTSIILGAINDMIRRPKKHSFSDEENQMKKDEE